MRRHCWDADETSWYGRQRVTRGMLYGNVTECSSSIRTWKLNRSVLPPFLSSFPPLFFLAIDIIFLSRVRALKSRRRWRGRVRLRHRRHQRRPLVGPVIRTLFFITIESWVKGVSPPSFWPRIDEQGSPGPSRPCELKNCSWTRCRLVQFNESTIGVE